MFFVYLQVDLQFVPGRSSVFATSMGSRTTGASTPIKIFSSLSVCDAGRHANGTLTTVSNLMKEFEKRKQNFDDGHGGSEGGKEWKRRREGRKKEV